MSEILTEAQVAALRKKFYIGHHGSEGALCDSHESLRGYFDALLQGATAQKVATLMNEADRMKDAFPADSVWDQHAVQCGNCEVWIIAKNSPLKANGFPSNGLSDTGQSEDEALCGMCAGAEMYRLMDEADKARVENERLNDHARQQVRIAKLEKERDTALELAARREKENRLILRLHKRKQGISDDALQHSIAERDAAERWESGFRNVVHALHGPQFAFDIPLVVEEVSAAIAERDGLRRAIESVVAYRHVSNGVNYWPHLNESLCDRLDGLARALAAVPAPVAQQGKSHAHQWFKNGDYREDSMFGISCPVWACGSCKITCSATDKPSENL